jgi:hypothetical protein
VNHGRNRRSWNETVVVASGPAVTVASGNRAKSRYARTSGTFNASEIAGDGGGFA